MGDGESLVAYFHLYPTRSKAAFGQLIADWRGILVSDGYLVYQYWPGLRQSCLAHLLRTAKGLAEQRRGRVLRALEGGCTASCSDCVIWARSGQWWGSGGRGMHVPSSVSQHTAREDKAGTFARRLAREGESLWMFLDVPGVEATNNFAERAHRFGVMWRKRSQGTCSEKGNRWVERVLSLRHTCRIRGRPTFPLLVTRCHVCSKGRRLICSWITPHESPAGALYPVIR